MKDTNFKSVAKFYLKMLFSGLNLSITHPTLLSKMWEGELEIGQENLYGFRYVHYEHFTDKNSNSFFGVNNYDHYNFVGREKDLVYI